MAVKTKSIYSPAKPGDGFRILVTRYWPRGVSKSKINCWYKEVAPSIALLKDWKRGIITEKEYCKRYAKEMNCTESQAIINKLAKLVESDKTITLLCFEKEGEFCHRHLLKEMVLEVV